MNCFLTAEHRPDAGATGRVWFFNQRIVDAPYGNMRVRLRKQHSFNKDTMTDLLDFKFTI